MKRSGKGGSKRPKAHWVLMVVGLFWIWFAFRITSDPTMPGLWSVEIDLRPFQIPMSIVSLGIGGYSLWLSVSQKRQKEDGYWICPKCEKIGSRSELMRDKCPGCHHTMEPLMGFYERHPELKK